MAYLIVAFVACVVIAIGATLATSIIRARQRRLTGLRSQERERQQQQRREAEERQRSEDTIAALTKVKAGDMFLYKGCQLIVMDVLCFWTDKHVVRRRVMFTDATTLSVRWFDIELRKLRRGSPYVTLGTQRVYDGTEPPKAYTHEGQAYRWAMSLYDQYASAKGNSRQYHGWAERRLYREAGAEDNEGAPSLLFERFQPGTDWILSEQALVPIADITPL